jgi:hypothetical protein
MATKIDNDQGGIGPHMVDIETQGSDAQVST